MKLKVVVALIAAIGVVGGTAAPNFARDQQCGGASWYAMAGNRTASGERMDPSAMTAAHRTLPFGTIVMVTNERNGRSLNLRINDRGPFVHGRIIDVSKAAATKLGFLGAGSAEVCIVQI
ncbi:MAG: septal ring lytic transglycosylase RlpA family protein [Cucumibacter sp.]